MRYFLLVLAVVVTACVCGTSLAAAQSDLRNPDNRVVLAQTDLRNPDNRVPPGHAGESVDIVPDTSASTPVVPDIPADGGLSAFAIVLISVGGAVAIGGAAFAATRVVHHHPPTVGH